MHQEIPFTKRQLDTLRPAKSGTRDYYQDPRAPASLRLSVTDTGAKSWVIQRRVNGRATRITLGRYPDLTPENAKRQAEQVAGQIAEGRDPQAEKRSARSNRITLADAFDELLKVRTLKTKTQNVYRQVLNAALGDWMNRPLTHITKDMVAERHAKLSRDS
ncbi:MAG: Arm DNA-binding domain-containing protein, partial [Gemmatimonadota bacterium]|nr:Arm DNA-binding domain-containing protein [Gemmatimonadota bacterium]